MASDPGAKTAINVVNQGMLVSDQIADAPTQRFYATSIFIALQAFKFYDYIQLYRAPSTAETVFVMKWIAIDAAFLLLLPKLKIPWLSFSLSTSFIQVALISVLNVCLSARIPISLSGIGAALLKLVYDRELSVLEHNVKVSDILHNSSRILGRHTVNILPESTAKLNPSASCYCVDSGEVELPIRLNSTIPMLLEYSRIDPETNKLFRYNLTGKALKSLIKHADRRDKVWELPLAVTSPGLYRLERVQDSSKLDVRLYRSQALVVSCPSAKFVIPEHLKANHDRCTGDMDELSIRASGLPPLRIKYNRWIEGRERVSTIDSVKPLEYTSPLMIGHHAQTLDPKEQQVSSFATMSDLTWATTRFVDVHLNSSLASLGAWSYTIEEIEDACGNIIKYSNHHRKSPQTPKNKLIKAVDGPTTEVAMVDAPSYAFRVHERPKISFRGCDPEHPTRLLSGRDSKIYFDVKSSEPGPFVLQLGYGQSDTVSSANTEGLEVFKELTIASQNQALDVREAGIYNIQSFRSQHCNGIIEMPSSCVVFTPARPSLAVSFEPILDKCAGPIGLLADLSFTGAPPFDVAWKVSKDGKATIHRRKVDRIRHQLSFRPEEAGHYQYEFTTVNDANYKGITLDRDSCKTEQTVRPLAGASFTQREMRKCCIHDSIRVPVRLVGSGPWDLVYEIIHAGKRQKFEKKGLTEAMYMLETPILSKGGTYTIALVSIQDSNGCRTPLEETDTTIEVRRERPSAGFYTIDEKRQVTIVEQSSVSLPLRLTGDGPWTVSYKDSEERQQQITTHDPNAKLSITSPGVYQLLSIHDAYCPGMVEDSTKQFEVTWFPRPRMSVPKETANTTTKQKFVRRDVCEGDEDTFEIDIFGAPPFSVSYERTYVGPKGHEQDKQKLEVNAALPSISIKARTSPAGTWRYSFLNVADARYDYAQRNEKAAFEIEQFVNSRPMALFADHDKTYNYCLEIDLADQESDKIPLNFRGQAPFQARFRVKHELTGKTEYLTSMDIQTHSWGLQVPSTLR